MNPDEPNQNTLTQIHHQAKKQAELQKQIETLETLAKHHMTKEALQRYGNIKAAHPDTALKALTTIAQLIQTRQLQHPLQDDELKQLLHHLTHKPTFHIKK